MKMPMQEWLELLRGLAPIEGLVHIGAGNGHCAEQYAEWDLPLAVLVEADEDHREKLSAAVRLRPGWRTYIAMVGEANGERDFYVASNPSESGLLSPERLNVLWRNLRTIENRHVQTFRLDDLIGTQDGDATPNWLVVDCFPALPVLQGAGRLLARADVVLARVILDEAVVSNSGATKIEIDGLLLGLGYRCVTMEEDRQPATGWALYMRDWRRLLEERLRESHDQVNQLGNALNEQLDLAVARQGELEQMIDAVEKHARLSDENRQKIEQLTQERTERERQASVAIGELSALVEEKNAQTIAIRETADQLARLKADLESQISDQQARILSLTSARDDATTRIGELDRALVEARNGQARATIEAAAQIEQLKVERDKQILLADDRWLKLEQQKKAVEEQTRLIIDMQGQVAALTVARDDANRAADEVKAKLAEITPRAEAQAARIAALEQERAEIDVRHGRLDQEMMKAEIQIELIKDVILRDKAF
jgi:hypothetical protein